MNVVNQAGLSGAYFWLFFLRVYGFELRVLRSLRPCRSWCLALTWGGGKVKEMTVL